MRNLSNRFIQEKKKNKKWAMLTAYDALTAELLENCGIDIILVGDSVGMVLLGYPSTVHVTMDEMIHHAKAVRRGAKRSIVIGDLPLKGIEKGPCQALESARRFIEEAGCDGVKLEWNRRAFEMTELLVRHKIPVMGHAGLTPQTVPPNRFRVQGTEARKAIEIFHTACGWERRGIFTLLLECVPFLVTKAITETLTIPTIGIGAGPFCDGQVLVFHDMVGLFKKIRPRFIRRYAELDPVMRRAVGRYIQEVHTGHFPQKKHGFGMKKEELEKFSKIVSSNSSLRGAP